MPQIASQNSFDFEKGCYVGQEVVSRIKHRGGARKRVVRVRLDGDARARDACHGWGAAGRDARGVGRRARSRCYGWAGWRRRGRRAGAQRGGVGSSWKRSRSDGGLRLGQYGEVGKILGSE